MRIRIAVPEKHVSPAILNAALEATTLANEAMLESGEVEPISSAIKSGRVKWKPEPFRDGEHFDLGQTVTQRGWGDCDDLAPALAAELRATGRDPGARAVVRKSGPNLWHAVTQGSDGRIYDPSRAAGMGRERGVQGTSIMGMIASGPVLGLRKVGSRWASRLDLPSGSPIAVCGLALRDSPLDAISEAVDTATVVGAASELADPRDVARALAIEAACAGDDYGDTLHALNGNVDPDELGAIFSDIAHNLAHVVPAANAYARHGQRAAASATMPTHERLVAELARIIEHTGVSHSEALQHASDAATQAMAHHGIHGDESSVGSFFGSILKTAASFVPIPGVSAVANAVVDAVDTGGGGGDAPAPAPGGGGAKGGAVPRATPIDWALQIRRGVVMNRSQNGAYMIRF